MEVTSNIDIDGDGYVGTVNQDPTLSGQKATLADGTRDTAYTINASDLLQGYSDSDGDTLSVDSLSATNGSLTDNNNGTWTFTPNADYNGTIDLTYNVVDGNGGSVAATQSFNLVNTPEVNFPPVVSGPVNLGSMQEDGTIKITKADLLANSSDPEGDPLFYPQLTGGGRARKSYRKY